LVTIGGEAVLSACLEIASIRSTLENLDGRRDLVRVQNQVAPEFEVAGIEKALDGGPALLFEDIKGYPGVRIVGNLFSDAQRTAELFGEKEFGRLKARFIEAIKSPLRPVVVEDAPCHEVVITDDIDVEATLPIITHSEFDGARVLSSGVLLVMAAPVGTGSDISFKRIVFRGKDWGTAYIMPGSHLDHIMSGKAPGERLPFTVNICAPPAVTMTAAAHVVKKVLPHGTDELAIAGALQREPVSICRAVSVDAYALAESEWTVEGYITTEQCWETEELEKTGDVGTAALFPEWHGYLGWARTGNRIVVTAITHRGERPIFYAPLADSFETYCLGNPLADATLLMRAQEVAPGLVKDVNSPPGFKRDCGLVVQVHKTTSADDARVREVVDVLLRESRRGLVMAVDEDIAIESSDDVLWAMLTRGLGDDAIFRVPMDSSDDPTQTGIPSQSGGLVGMDATIPFARRSAFKRAKYPVDKIDLLTWFSQDAINDAHRRQGEYARLLGRLGH
jgi:gallate decarboxylase subunit C